MGLKEVGETRLILAPWRPGKVSCIERRPYFRGELIDIIFGT